MFTSAKVNQPKSALIFSTPAILFAVRKSMVPEEVIAFTRTSIFAPVALRLK